MLRIGAESMKNVENCHQMRMTRYEAYILALLAMMLLLLLLQRCHTLEMYLFNSQQAAFMYAKASAVEFKIKKSRERMGVKKRPATENVQITRITNNAAVKGGIR